MLTLLKKLEDKFSNEFEQVEINDLICFVLPSGAVANLVLFKEWKAIAAQYADSIEEAKRNLFEDGQLWYTEEMTEDEIFDSLMKEMNEDG